ncbi:hypothetical protein HPB50_016666 [Hyalomma asiaticum]|uniref:Uncharacterized protein n=1 Tax=Hyalomma asiaticum TaxID=266040 RepID=A0ACB7TJD2_HYAAI|nr:hypothetical protein HPB50_016666 [Hyalomma asiaticum]
MEPGHHALVACCTSDQYHEKEDQSQSTGVHNDEWRRHRRVLHGEWSWGLVQRRRRSLGGPQWKGMFSGKAIDHASPCTATEDRACQIVRHLSALNEVLSEAKLKVMPDPTTPSRMTIASVDNPYLRDHSLEMLYKAVTLLCQVVKMHYCVTYIEVSITRLNLYGHLLCDALRVHKFVETLKLRDSSGLHLTPHESFCVIIPTLRKLRHFECTLSAKCGKCWP